MEALSRAPQRLHFLSAAVALALCNAASLLSGGSFVALADKGINSEQVGAAVVAGFLQFLILYVELGILAFLYPTHGNRVAKTSYAIIVVTLTAFWVLSWWTFSTFGVFLGPIVLLNVLSLDTQAIFHIGFSDILLLGGLVAASLVTAYVVLRLCGRLAFYARKVTLIKWTVSHALLALVLLSLPLLGAGRFKSLKTLSLVISPELSLIHEISLIRQLSSQSVEAPGVPMQSIEEWEKSARLTPRSRPDVVVILVEALRADVLGEQRNPAVVVPNMYELSRSGTLFARAFAGAPETGLAIESTLLGTYPYLGPLRHTVSKSTTGRGPSLYDLLTRVGYRIGHFSATDWSSTKNLVTRSPGVFYQVPQGSVVSDEHQSFSVGDLKRVFSAHSRELARFDKSSVASFKQWVEKNDSNQPSFSFIYLVSSHFPWIVEETGTNGSEGSGDALEPFSLFSKDMLEKDPKLRVWYERALRQVDGFVGQILEVVKNRRKGRPVIVILLGDHGESLGEHGQFLHPSALYDAQIRIPIITSTGDTTSVVSHEPASQIDVAPSILHMVGLPPFNGFQGRDVLAQSAGRGAARPIFFSLHSYKLLLGAVEWPFKGIYDVWDGRLKLYDIERDPDEKEDRAPLDTERAEKFRKLISLFQARQTAYYTWGQARTPSPVPPHYD